MLHDFLAERIQPVWQTTPIIWQAADENSPLPVRAWCSDKDAVVGIALGLCLQGFVPALVVTPQWWKVFSQDLHYVLRLMSARADVWIINPESQSVILVDFPRLALFEGGSDATGKHAYTPEAPEKQPLHGGQVQRTWHISAQDPILHLNDACLRACTDTLASCGWRVIHDHGMNQSWAGCHVRSAQDISVSQQCGFSQQAWRIPDGWWSGEQFQPDIGNSVVSIAISTQEVPRKCIPGQPWHDDGERIETMLLCTIDDLAVCREAQETLRKAAIDVGIRCVFLLRSDVVAAPKKVRWLRVGEACSLPIPGMAENITSVNETDICENVRRILAQ